MNATHRPELRPIRRTRFLSLFGVACAFAAPLLFGGTARAQWGWGGGWGFGGGGSYSNMATLQNINDRSSQAASHAYSIRQNIPGTGNVYANNPNAFSNHLRDTSFYQTFDVSTRRSTGQAAARGSQRRTSSAAAPTAPKPPAALPLSQFFNGGGVLVWPSESPTTGELGEQRTQANTAVSTVFQNVKTEGFAPVATVSDARMKLVEYGQPALEYMSQHTTTAVVDAFHQFLLSLYDSLGAAGTANKG
jgi:hypothetical protein